MMRRRAPRRSCPTHGDNGCEVQGEAGPVGRSLERRRWAAEAELERLALEEERAALAPQRRHEHPPGEVLAAVPVRRLW